MLRFLSKKYAKERHDEAVRRLIRALIISNAVSMGLLIARMFASGSYRYWFLPWNLFLAWVPLLFAWWFRQNHATKPLSHWTNILLLILWLGFLPNSFYIISDYIHLTAYHDVNVLFDVVTFGSFTINGFILGFMALYMVHQAILKNMRSSYAHGLIALVIALCSFAIYLGRYLRWNTWDIFINPAGLLFDVSDRLINPSAYPLTFSTTIIFLAFLGSLYYITYELVSFIKQTTRQ